MDISLCVKLHRNINYKKYYSVDLIPFERISDVTLPLKVYNQTSDSFTIKIPQVFFCDLLATDCRPLRFAYRTINYNLFCCL